MTFTSEFDVRDEVYALIDNTPTKCVVRKIEFPSPSVWCCTQTNDSILYYLAPCKSLDGDVFRGTVEDSKRYEREVGRTLNELCEKILKLYGGK